MRDQSASYATSLLADTLSQQLAEQQERLSLLQSDATAPAEDLEESLLEISVANEELRVAQKELRVAQEGAARAAQGDRGSAQPTAQPRRLARTCLLAVAGSGVRHRQFRNGPRRQQRGDGDSRPGRGRLAAQTPDVVRG